MPIYPVQPGHDYFTGPVEGFKAAHPAGKAQPMDAYSDGEPNLAQLGGQGFIKNLPRLALEWTEPDVRAAIFSYLSEHEDALFESAGRGDVYALTVLYDIASEKPAREREEMIGKIVGIVRSVATEELWVDILLARAARSNNEYSSYRELLTELARRDTRGLRTVRRRLVQTVTSERDRNSKRAVMAIQVLADVIEGDFYGTSLERRVLMGQVLGGGKMGNTARRVIAALASGGATTHLQKIAIMRSLFDCLDIATQSDERLARKVAETISRAIPEDRETGVRGFVFALLDEAATLVNPQDEGRAEEEPTDSRVLVSAREYLDGRLSEAQIRAMIDPDAADTKGMFVEMVPVETLRPKFEFSRADAEATRAAIDVFRRAEKLRDRTEGRR